MKKMTRGDIWVYVDLRSDRFFRFSLNVLAAAIKLSKSSAGQAVAVLMGASASDKSSRNLPAVSVDTAEKDATAHGANRVYILENSRLSQTRADIHAAVLAKAVKSRQPLLVLFASSDFGREIAARTARICNAGLIADCLDLNIGPDGIKATCPSWGGDILADISFSENMRTGLATVQPHAFQAEPMASKSAVVERVPTGSIRTPKGIRRLSCVVETEEHRKLEEAETVVVGGAGLGNLDGFAMVRDLAASLGGEVGATRPPVLQHWADGEKLIGQTGKTVRPKLLVSIGTSGAVQYTAGIMESKTIVAVNRDPVSPIFQVADIGIVADARSFLPILISKIKQRVMRNLADALTEGEVSRDAGGFGTKVRQLRESQGWPPEKLAQATGQSPEFIQKIEANEISPSVSFLLRLAGAFEVDPGTFLREEEKTKIRDMRTQAYIKRTQSYNYQTLTDGFENDHLRAFLVAIESRQTHKPVAYKHEGEEFIYVLEGHLELTLGGKVRDLKPGESIHFQSDTPHKLKNLSNQTTRLLVVLYTI